MDNKAWKRGDTVMFVPTGDEYVIDGFGHCPGCGEPTLCLVGLNEIVNSTHQECGFREVAVRKHYVRHLFIRPDLSSLTEYRNQVSVREIPSELKKLEPLQNQ